MSTKTDNGNLALKIQLRRVALRAAGFATLDVLDLFAGRGEIWSRLRRDFSVGRYLGCDRERKQPGLLIGDSQRLVQRIDVAQFNVVDIDTYGEPWDLWAKVAPRLQVPAVVFLTDGKAGLAGISKRSLESVGIPREWPAFGGADLAIYVAHARLSQIAARFEIGGAWQAKNRATHYYALWLSAKRPHVA